MTRPAASIYKAGFCTTGAAAWSHAKCSHTYGHPPYEATCSCTCHDPVDAQVSAAFEHAKATCHDIIDQRFRMTLWFTRGQVGPDLVANLHAAFPDLWDVAIEPVAVPR
ncbi:MAG TPA: hypothetical protein VIL68_02550 [Propionibacteriaceae bacterium]